MFYFLDPTFLLLIPPMLLAFYASAKVKSAFSEYSQVRSASGITGADAARGVLRSGGVQNVSIERTSGHLSDHYDPRKGVLRLSEPVYDSNSLKPGGARRGRPRGRTRPAGRPGLRAAQAEAGNLAGGLFRQ